MASMDQEVDQQIRRLEEATQRHIDLAGSAVKGASAEFNLLTAAEGARDFLLKAVRADRDILHNLFGINCERWVRLRTLLDTVKLSKQRESDTRWKDLRQVLDTTQAILKDRGTFKGLQGSGLQGSSTWPSLPYTRRPSRSITSPALPDQGVVSLAELGEEPSPEDLAMTVESQRAEDVVPQVYSSIQQLASAEIHFKLTQAVAQAAEGAEKSEGNPAAAADQVLREGRDGGAVDSLNGPVHEATGAMDKPEEAPGAALGIVSRDGVDACVGTDFGRPMHKATRATDKPKEAIVAALGKVLGDGVDACVATDLCSPTHEASASMDNPNEAPGAALGIASGDGVDACVATDLCSPMHEAGQQRVTTFSFTLPTPDGKQDESAGPELLGTTASTSAGSEQACADSDATAEAIEANQAETPGTLELPPRPMAGIPTWQKAVSPKVAVPVEVSVPVEIVCRPVVPVEVVCRRATTPAPGAVQPALPGAVSASPAGPPVFTLPGTGLTPQASSVKISPGHDCTRESTTTPIQRLGARPGTGSTPSVPRLRRLSAIASNGASPTTPQGVAMPAQHVALQAAAKGPFVPRGLSAMASPGVQVPTTPPPASSGMAQALTPPPQVQTLPPWAHAGVVQTPAVQAQRQSGLQAPSAPPTPQQGHRSIGQVHAAVTTSRSPQLVTRQRSMPQPRDTSGTASATLPVTPPLSSKKASQVSPVHRMRSSPVTTTTPPPGSGTPGAGHWEERQFIQVLTERRWVSHGVEDVVL